jgi:hypothetical protein
MTALDWTYVFLAAEPLGGLLMAIPLGILKLDYPWWVTVLSGPPLAYLQVLAVDGLWSLLERWPWFVRTLERRRSARIERLLAGGAGFWATFAAAPLVGPWVVMAFLRYARIPQRRAALPILLAMLAVSLVVTAVCVLAPAAFQGAA